MPLKRLDLQHMNRSIDTLAHWAGAGYLELNPPYQRGSVWNRQRQRNLIMSVLQGIPIGSLIINDRLKAEWPEQCITYAIIDGKQRCQALLDFMSGKLDVPTDWFPSVNIASYVIDAEWITWNGLTLATQRHFKHRPLATAEAALPDLEAERHVFELVNFGGVPQGESDNGQEV